MTGAMSGTVCGRRACDPGVSHRRNTCGGVPIVQEERNSNTRFPHPPLWFDTKGVVGSWDAERRKRDERARSVVSCNQNKIVQDIMLPLVYLCMLVNYICNLCVCVLCVVRCVLRSP